MFSHILQHYYEEEYIGMPFFTALVAIAIVHVHIYANLYSVKCYIPNFCHL